MKLRDLAEKLALERLTPELAKEEDAEVTGGHVSDLLSDVLANAPAGGVLITIQAHINTVAVALHARLAAVILASGRRPEPEVIERASEEKVPLYLSGARAFDLAGALYALGIKGERE